MTHRGKVLLALLLLTLVSSASARASSSAQDPLPPRVYLPLVSRSYPELDLGYGIQAHALDATEYTMGLINDLGMGWIKQQIRWEHVERSEGSYQWGDPDRIANAAEQAGLQVLFSVVAAPSWARPGKPGSGPPDDPQDLARFMAAMATRYRGRVAAYEI
jgi:hypothetical protein